MISSTSVDLYFHCRAEPSHCDSWFVIRGIDTIHYYYYSIPLSFPFPFPSCPNSIPILVLKFIIIIIDNWHLLHLEYIWFFEQHISCALYALYSVLYLCSPSPSPSPVLYRCVLCSVLLWSLWYLSKLILIQIGLDFPSSKPSENLEVYAPGSYSIIIAPAPAPAPASASALALAPAPASTFGV